MSNLSSPIIIVKSNESENQQVFITPSQIEIQNTFNKDAQKAQSSQKIELEVDYIKGKQLDNKNRIYYLCQLQDGTQDWIQITKLIKYQTLLDKYESFHSRILFHDLYVENNEFKEELLQKQQDILKKNKQRYHNFQKQQPQQYVSRQTLKQLDSQNYSQTVQEEQQQRKHKFILEDQSEVISVNSNDLLSAPGAKQIQKPRKEKTRINIHTPISSDEENENRRKYKPRLSDMQFFVKNQKQKDYGSFNKDKPSMISNHKMDVAAYQALQQLPNIEQSQYKVQCYYYKVEWKPREDTGKSKKGHYYTYKELKKVAPRLLLDYIEKMGRILR